MHRLLRFCLISLLLHTTAAQAAGDERWQILEAAAKQLPDGPPPVDAETLNDFNTPQNLDLVRRSLEACKSDADELKSVGSLILIFKQHRDSSTHQFDGQAVSKDIGTQIHWLSAMDKMALMTAAISAPANAFSFLRARDCQFNPEQQFESGATKEQILNMIHLEMQAQTAHNSNKSH